jgi:hypothetical protein
MRMRAPRLRLIAMAGLAAFALLGIAPDGVVTAPPSPPAADPAILDVTWSPQHLRPGHTFDVTIHTTPDITVLEACVLRYRLPVPKASDGVFYASARVPWFARFFHGTFHVTFVGTNANGDQAQMEADVHI